MISIQVNNLEPSYVAEAALRMPDPALSIHFRNHSGRKPSRTPLELRGF
jgi:hypothetical protein